MKFGFVAISLLAIFSSNSYAYQCNTVMGGCPTDTNAGATSSHMKSEIVNKVPAQQQSGAVAPASGTKATATPSNAAGKKSQGSLIQTINKNVLK